MFSRGHAHPDRRAHTCDRRPFRPIAQGPTPSPSPPAALRRPQSQSPAAAGSRTSRFLVAGLRRSGRSSAGAGQNRHTSGERPGQRALTPDTEQPETEPRNRRGAREGDARHIQEVRAAVRWDARGDAGDSGSGPSETDRQ